MCRVTALPANNSVMSPNSLLRLEVPSLAGENQAGSFDGALEMTNAVDLTVLACDSARMQDKTRVYTLGASK